MKSVMMILVLAMALLFGGCAMTPNAPTTPTSVVNTLDQALCNPSDTVKADASAVASFIQSALSAAATIYPPLAPISGVSVAGIFTTVQQGGCVFAEDLKAALAWFDALTGQVQAKAKAKKGKKELIVAPSASNLRSWVK